MQSSSQRRRAKLRILGPGVLLAASASLAGCDYLHASYYAQMPEEFCGVLYYCGSHSDTNRGGGQTATGGSSDSSSSTTGESTAPIGAD